MTSFVAAKHTSRYSVLFSFQRRCRLLLVCQSCAYAFMLEWPGETHRLSKWLLIDDCSLSCLINRSLFWKWFSALVIMDHEINQTPYVGGPRNCPWGVPFWKGQRVNGSNVTFSEQTTPGWDHTAAKGTRRLLPSTASFAQQKAHGV